MNHQLSLAKSSEKKTKFVAKASELFYNTRFLQGFVMKKSLFFSTLFFGPLLLFSPIHAYDSFDNHIIENHLEASYKHLALHDLHCKYVQNPYVDEALWNELQPYFLPENHPVKIALDSVFSKKRLLLSRKSMKDAGFNILRHPQRDIVIARHPRIKDYLVKAYLDNKKIDEWKWWKKRIDGVRQVQECIDRYNFNGMMKTPKKWIYPLPSEPSPPNAPGIKRKNFILVVEDMNILSKKENLKAFKNHMTIPLLNALFIVLTENLLVDSIYAPNIPFCRDGKIAILDTEHFNNITRPMKLWKMMRYLNPEMRAYWKELVPQFTPVTAPI